MFIEIKKYTVYIILFLATVILPQSLYADTSLERKLVASMKLNKMTKERIGDSGYAIRSYIHNKYLNKKPKLRYDYTDYWVLKKKASFMGQQLLVIEEEYMSKYVGCCVSPGVGVILKIKGNLNKLNKFAKSNGCSLEKGSEVRNQLRTIHVKVNNRSKYVSLSCRERDIPDAYFIATNEDEYKVQYNEYGAVLTSVDKRVRLYLGSKCDASSKSYGKGVWFMKYGDLTVQFGKKKIKFPRQEIKIEKSQECY